MKALRGERDEKSVEGVVRDMAPRVGSTTVQIRAGGTEWRETAQRIYEYYRREMSDATVQRRRIYEKTWDTQIQRTIPLIWRMVRERATLYLRPVDRALFTEDGKPITGPALDAQRAEYKRAKVDRRLRTTQEHLSALQNATLWVWLTSTGYRLLTPPIHDQWVTLGRIDGQEVEDVVAWRVRFPVISDPFATSVPTAMALITRDIAVWESGPKGWAGVGIWRNDRSNPFGRIPVVYLRGCDPAPGEFFVPVPDDSLDAQRAANADLTDEGAIARKQGYAQGYVKGITQAQATELETGPESLVGIPNEGELGYASPKADLAGYGAQLDAYLKLVIACSGMSPATVMKSTGITALAKIVENIDREVERQRDKDEFESGEQALYELIQLATEIGNGGVAVLPKGAIVRVTHREPITPADPINDAQAKKMRIDMVVECAASVIAAEKAIPLDEAQQIAKDNLRRQRELGALPADLDDTQSTTPKPDDGAVTTTPAPTTAEVQKEALNGAQMLGMKDIVKDAADGFIPVESARWMLRASLPSVEDSVIDGMLGPLANFQPKSRAPAPTTFVPASEGEDEAVKP